MQCCLVNDYIFYSEWMSELYELSWFCIETGPNTEVNNCDL